jgi:beta-lactamase regulating signal transducer with metallopeptidase domain
MMVPLTSFVWSSIQVSLIASIALILCWCLRGTRPQFTTALFSGCALASLALGFLAWFPSIQWSIGDPRLASWAGPALPNTALSIEPPTLPERDSHEAFDSRQAATTVESQATFGPDTPTQESESRSPVPALFARWILSNVQWIDAGVREAEHAPLVSPSRWDWIGSLRWVVGIGVGLMSALWVHAWLWMRWMVQASEPLSCPSLGAKLRRISEQLNLLRQPTLRVSDRVPIGATVGVRRPVLLLHRNWERWTEQELEAVLLHESAHIARNDFLWAVIGSWVRVLFFFHPLMHLLMLRWRMEQELAADQLAAGWMKDARAYGRALASLALRADGTVRTPSPMLSAEQICVIRRITMLKQGRLIPQRNGWRWGSVMTAVTLAVCLPLTGLLGTPPEDELLGQNSASESSSDPVDSQQTPTPVDAGEDASDEEKLQTFRERLEKLKEVREKCPPLQFDGFMVWRPSQFRSEDFDPAVLYYHNAWTFVLLGMYPEDGSVYGRTHIVSSWSDTEKEHGELAISAQISEADSVSPKILSRLLTGPLRQSQQVKTIEGRQATAITKMVFDPESGSQKESDSLAGWMVDDELGFLHGSEEEIAARLQGKTDPYANIPADFLEQYRTAAFATVFADCTTWQKDIEEHTRGSKDQKTVELAFPLINGLRHLGFFVLGDDAFDCILRASYSAPEMAVESKNVLDGLLFLARTAIVAAPNQEDVQPLKDFLGSLRIDQIDRELRIRFNPPRSLLQSEALLSQIRSPAPAGWSIMLGSTHSVEGEPNTMRLQGSSAAGCMPAFLTQSISAEKLRGKRVRLNAELTCDSADVAHAGLVLWASKQNGVSIAAASIAADGASTIASIANHDTHVSKGRGETRTRPVAVELDVPDDCDVLSIGIYAKDVEVAVSKVRMEANPRAVRAQPVATPLTPYNLLQIPFAPIHEHPVNLDFSMPQEVFVPGAPGIAEKVPDSLRK